MKNSKIQFLPTFAALFLVSSLSVSALAAPKITEVNYYSSLRSNETNVRAGPGQNYPIKFTFKLKGMPVRVINEYDNWLEIEDFEGQTGWLSQSLVTKKRTLMIQTKKEFINFYAKNHEKSRVIFRLENHVVVDYIECQSEKCLVKVNGKKGWISRAEVFGAADIVEKRSNNNSEEE